MSSVSVRLDHVSKRFILHHERTRSFQDALVRAFQRRNGSREEFWALKDVSLAVGEGESVGILGRNGSGKSTILKLITRILEPTSGRITVDGKVSALIELGAGFHPDLTGRENIYLNGSILGIGRKEMNRKFDEIVAFSELERFLDTPVRHYSSGMYARLGFTVAISVEPKILIVDEVLAVGDESFQRKCLDKIREFKSRGVSILFVSHSLDAVRTLCDWAIWLDRGVIRAQGGASEIADEYLADANLMGHSNSQRSDGLQVHGNPEIHIGGLELLDFARQRGGPYSSGDQLTVRVHYHARTAISDPVFWLKLHSEEGVELARMDTRSDGYSIGPVLGAGWVEYAINSLPLAAGKFVISVGIEDRSGTVAYDSHDRAYPFEVKMRADRAFSGLVTIPGRWGRSEGNEETQRQMSGASDNVRPVS